MAESHNVTLAPHSPYFGPGLLATVHLVAATPRAQWLEYLYVTPEASVFCDFPTIQEGSFPIPQGPGLGLEIDLDVLHRYCEPLLYKFIHCRRTPKTTGSSSRVSCNRLLASRAYLHRCALPRPVAANTIGFTQA